MRYAFSTEVVDLDNQAPNRNKRESRYFWDELNHLISAGGFSGIEIPYEPKWDFGGRSGIPRTLRSILVKFDSVAAYMEFLKDNGIESIDCVHMNPSLFCRGASPMYFGAFGHFAQEAVEFAAQAGCGTVTISVTPPVYKIRSLADFESEEVFLEKTKEVITALAGKAAEAGVQLCLKNEYWGLLRGEKILAFADSLGADVKLDADTANLYIAGVEPQQFVKEHLDRIGIVHLTDTSFTDTDNTWETALPEFPAGRTTKIYTDPGEGEVDLKAVINVLKEAGYDGTAVLDPKDSYDISRSILRVRYFLDTQEDR